MLSVLANLYEATFMKCATYSVHNVRHSVFKDHLQEWTGLPCCYSLMEYMPMLKLSAWHMLYPSHHPLPICAITTTSSPASDIFTADTDAIALPFSAAQHPPLPLSPMYFQCRSVPMFSTLHSSAVDLCTTNTNYSPRPNIHTNNLPPRRKPTSSSCGCRWSPRRWRHQTTNCFACTRQSELRHQPRDRRWRRPLMNFNDVSILCNQTYMDWKKFSFV